MMCVVCVCGKNIQSNPNRHFFLVTLIIQVYEKFAKEMMIAAVLQKHQTPLEIIKVPKVSSLGRNEVLIQGKYTIFI